MKKGQLWTRQELILVLRLYYWLPFGKMHSRNPEVIRLASLIQRTPSSIALKLVNFAGIDPDLDRKGMANASKLDVEIWSEFYKKWEELAKEAEHILWEYETQITSELHEPKVAYGREGKDKVVLAKQRINQSFFRKTIIAAYEQTCCITGIKQKELLVAGHIKPWAEDKANRLNPANGILINSLHDKAFENGLITIDTHYRVKVATEVLKTKDNNLKQLFIPYKDKKIILPTKYLPDRKFLEYHNQEKFRG